MNTTQQQNALTAHLASVEAKRNTLFQEITSVAFPPITAKHITPIGIAGCGKGTFINKLTTRQPFSIIYGMSDMLKGYLNTAASAAERDHVKHLTENGKYAPDTTVFAAYDHFEQGRGVAGLNGSMPYAHVIRDGIPRTLEQINELHNKYGVVNDVVIHFDITPQESARRQITRAIETVQMGGKPRSDVFRLDERLDEWTRHEKELVEKLADPTYTRQFIPIHSSYFTPSQTALHLFSALTQTYNGDMPFEEAEHRLVFADMAVDLARAEQTHMLRTASTPAQMDMLDRLSAMMQKYQ